MTRSGDPQKPKAHTSTVFAEAVLLMLTVQPLVGKTQQPAKQADLTVSNQARPKDYSKEAFVVELLNNTERFEKDGTGTRDFTMRVRVQSEAGVTAFGQLVMPYNSANERFERQQVKILKPDGAVITAGADSIQDLSSGIERAAPMYSDLRQKHITVPGLRPGDVLEYSHTVRVYAPYAPGHFWGALDFVHEGICLKEVFELNVPREGHLTFKSKLKTEPLIKQEGDRKIYSWTQAQLLSEEELKQEALKNSKKPTEKATPSSDIQFSSFQSWAQIGTWYESLERDRRASSPELIRKTNELIADKKSEQEKVEAIYSFVATNYRYVSLSFGLGRFQPHTAAEVFANQYGDCKDKNTLLSAMLSIAGFTSRSALIGSSHALDADLPSPGQFDHVITQVEIGKDHIWLDTTAEVAPFQFLLRPLRKKQSLVIRPLDQSRLEETPAELPFKSTERREYEGVINATGDLHMRASLFQRGDEEYLLRMFVRRMPEARWKGLMQFEIASDSVTNDEKSVQVRAGDPATIDQPFFGEVTYDTLKFLQNDSGEATDLRLPIASPKVKLDDKENKENTTREGFNLGSPRESETKLTLTFPSNIKVRLPVSVSVKRDYAEYRSEYKLEGRVLSLSRKLRISGGSLSSERSGDWASFQRTVEADQSQQIRFEGIPIGQSALAEGADAKALFEAGNKAYNKGDFSNAAKLYARVVDLEPKHNSAWNDLGRCYLNTSELDKAAMAFQKAIEVNPYEEWAYNNLGLVYHRQQKLKDAMASFKKQIEVSPLDRYAHKNLALVYLDTKQWSVALAEIEQAISITPNDSDLHVRLGTVYLNLDKEDKALEAFARAVKLLPSPYIFNNIAYQLCLKKVGLDKAKQYAESAISTAEATLRTMSLSDKLREQQALTASLSSYWDTLGWIHFQRGDLQKAEPYIVSAWSLSRSGEVANHLGQLFEKQGLKEKAARYHASALVALVPQEDSKSPLDSLVVNKRQVTALIEKARAEQFESYERKMETPAKEDSAKEFCLSFLPESKLEEIQFKSGSGDGNDEKDKTTLRSLKVDVSFPPDSSTRLVKSGVLIRRKNSRDLKILFLPSASFGSSPEALMQLQPISTK
jgi:Flp pilus assembly protein TadD/transglutaminase-like putative cysteine protease